MVRCVNVMLVVVSDDDDLYTQAFSVKRHTKFRLEAKPHAIVWYSMQWFMGISSQSYYMYTICPQSILWYMSGVDR